MAETLYASFPDHALAERAAAALMDSGVLEKDISLVMKDVPAAPAAGERVTHTATLEERPVAEVSRYQADNRDVDRRDLDRDEDRKLDRGARRDPGEAAADAGLTTTTPADAGAGAAKGAGIGLGLGILGAIASIAVPGFGLVIGGGALATAIGAAVATTVAGAVTGGVYGYLKEQGMPDHVAANYQKAYERGETLLSVQTPSNGVSLATVEQILDKYAAQNVSRLTGAVQA